MNGKFPIGLLGVAVVAALLAVHGPPVRAQPVASITLPPPGATKQLYPGCNNISLTFPDGTTSDVVVQAVSPAGAAESMWRHNAALSMFEAFSPAAPQASDLLSVNFLDSVWVCVAVALPPAPTPLPATPTATPVPPPAPTATSEAPQLGMYSGTTSQGETIWFEVVGGTRAIGRSLWLATATCGVGCVCEARHETTEYSRWPIVDNAFSYSSDQVDISGVFDSPTTAHGDIKWHERPGESPCNYGSITWTASAR
jgi:hypothetical protein